MEPTVQERRVQATPRSSTTPASDELASFVVLPRRSFVSSAFFLGWLAPPLDP